MIPYEELKSKFSNNLIIPYFELLKTKEWFDKRAIILTRDNNRCTKFGKEKTHSQFDNNTRKTIYYWLGEMKVSVSKNKYGNSCLDFKPEMIIKDQAYNFHVHHKFYVLDHLPWEYLDTDLVVLCNWCHWDFHENNTVPVYRNLKNKLVPIDLTPCLRCNGVGLLDQYSYHEDGICFRCKGARFEELILL